MVELHNIMEELHSIMVELHNIMVELHSIIVQLADIEIVSLNDWFQILGDQQAALVGQACFKPGNVKNT